MGFMCVFFLFFAGMGTLFLVLGVKEVAAAHATRSWVETPCVILESGAEPDGDAGYVPTIRYRYTFAGAERTSESTHRQRKTFDNVRDADAFAARYTVGGETVCYVNPDDPDRAVLERDRTFGPAILAIPLALVFVAVGLGGIVFLFRRKAGSANQPAARTRSAGVTVGGKRFAGVFFGIFLFVGLVVFWFMGIGPTLRYLDARDWREVECEILASGVKSHRSDDGTTYSIAVLYRYTWEGVERRSSDYGLSNHGSSGYDGKRETVRGLPVGKRVTGYVDPDDPTRAVLARHLPGIVWFSPFALIFVAIGLAGVTGKIGGKSKTPGMAADRPADVPLQSGSIDGQIVLQQRHSPWVKVLGLLAFALFWNGIVSVFVTQMIGGWRRGNPDWFLTLFLVPFVLIGLLIIGGVVHQFLAVFNPRPALKLRPGRLVLGGEFELEWHLSGAAHRLRDFHLELVGEEKATYRRGTRTTTDTAVFARVPLVEETGSRSLRHGQTFASVPAVGVPTFHSDNNRIEWFLRLHGSIARWPDLDAEFPVEVAFPLLESKRAVQSNGEDAVARTSAPGGELKVTLKDGRGVFRPGATIRGRVDWTLERPPVDARVNLYWFTRGKGTEDLHVVDHQPVTAAVAQGGQDFEFTLPAGPFSFDGTLIAVTWGVELVCNEPPGAAGVEFVVSPFDGLVRLEKLAEDKSRRRPFLRFGR